MTQPLQNSSVLNKPTGSAPIDTAISSCGPRYSTHKKNYPDPMFYQYYILSHEGLQDRDEIFSRHVAGLISDCDKLNEFIKMSRECLIGNDVKNNAHFPNKGLIAKAKNIFWKIFDCCNRRAPPLE